MIPQTAVREALVMKENHCYRSRYAHIVQKVGFACLKAQNSMPTMEVETWPSPEVD